MVDLKEWVERWYTRIAASHDTLWGREIQELRRQFPRFEVSRNPDESLQQRYYRIHGEIREAQHAAYDALANRLVADDRCLPVKDELVQKSEEFSKASIVRRRAMLQQWRNQVSSGDQIDSV